MPMNGCWLSQLRNEYGHKSYLTTQSTVEYISFIPLHFR